MIVEIILIAVASVAIGILAWKLHKKESSQEEVINKPVSEPTPIEEKPEKPKEEGIGHKFDVGDWVVSPNGVYWHVDAIRDGRYQVSANSGECTDWSLNTNIYHKFTPQDAKEGDVLVDICDDFVNPLIFILKKFEHKNYGLAKLSDYSSYCFLTAGDRQMFKEGKYYHENNIKAD